jgi:hypothetical protein
LNHPQLTERYISLTEVSKQRFAEICRAIEEISFKYFDDIDGKVNPSSHPPSLALTYYTQDVEKVHEELVAADPCFASVPIDDSEDSCNLRIAHAQRIISNVICEYIWKPFRSEFTLSHPDLNDLLAKISDELEKSSQGGRAANVWTAQTMRALQSIPTDSIPSRASEFNKPLRPSSGRAEGVVSKVLSVLSPLLSSSQYEDLRIDLLNLAKPAIDIWNDAQTGELKIIVSPLLEPAHREEWRSQKFDPASPSSDYDDMSKTHPRIFTLFPRVVARGVADPIKHEAGPPGSWSPEFDQAPCTVETCIHPGIGLPEWSSLVVRGKEEQEERNEYLSKALENAKKQLHSNRRLTGLGRRDSMGSSTSVPSSPSQKWKMGGTMKFPEQ